MNPPPPERRSLASALLGIGRHQARNEWRRQAALHETRRANAAETARLREAYAGTKARDAARAEERQREAERQRLGAEQAERALLERERDVRLHARSRWVLAVYLFLVTGLVFGYFALVFDSVNRALDQQGLTVYARVLEHDGYELRVVYPHEGQRLLFTIDEPDDQRADLLWVRERWEEGREVLVKIEFVPDHLAIAVPHGERFPSGPLTYFAGTALLLALLAFGWHVRVSRNHPGLPEGESLFRRSRGGLWRGVRPWILVSYTVGLWFGAIAMTSPAEPVVDPRYAEAEVLEYWDCYRECTGYGGEVQYLVDGLYYYADVDNVPPYLGAEVEVSFPAAEPYQARTVSGYEEEPVARINPAYLAVVLLVICGCCAFYPPLAHRLGWTLEHESDDEDENDEGPVKFDNDVRSPLR